VYPQFFGLTKLPFRLRPDADFLYPGAEYLRARGKLMTALEAAHRVLLLLGHGGLGKTLLVDDVLEALGADGRCCRINQPRISASELLEALILQAGSSSTDAENGRARSCAELAASLDAIGARGSAPLLVVDDAHLLPLSTAMAFTEILARAPNIRIVLSGRSGLGLEETTLRFLAGEAPRVIRLSPLTQQETRSYIDHRLNVAGGRNHELLAAQAYPLIFQHTGGVPRLINVLCDTALHTACLRASGQLSATEVLIAIQDSRWPEAVARDRAGAAAAAREFVEHETPESAVVRPPPQGLLVVTVNNKTLSTWPLPPGRVRIGRAPDNEFRLDARFISRHHCQVITVGAVSTIEDLESVNGISVNGRVVKQHVLQHADQVRFGDHTLTYLQG
jgi:general secretion pathway protein A